MVLEGKLLSIHSRRLSHSESILHLSSNKSWSRRNVTKSNNLGFIFHLFDLCVTSRVNSRDHIGMVSYFKHTVSGQAYQRQFTSTCTWLTFVCHKLKTALLESAEEEEWS